MAITVVGAPDGAGASGVTTLPLLARSMGTIGNLMVVAMQVASGTAVPTISDTQANVWSNCPTFNDVTNTNTLRIFYAYAKNLTSTTITVASNVAAAFMSVVFSEFAWNGAQGFLDKTANSLTGQSGTPISQSFTPNYNDELIFEYGVDSVVAPAGNIDGSAGTLAGDDGFNDRGEYRILVGRAGISMTAAFTGSGTYDTTVATFAPAQGGYTEFTKPFPFRPGSYNRGRR